MKKTKIVCTIGPASESVDMLVNLINAGMNVCRLNFSHGDYEEHGARIKNIREAVKITGKRVAILLDTKGPEIRTNDMENGAITMKIGDSKILTTNQRKRSENMAVNGQILKRKKLPKTQTIAVFMQNSGLKFT